MIGDPKSSLLTNSIISAVSFEGLSITTISGEPATLAVVDKDGKIVEMGPNVAREAWNVALASYKNFLKGTGHLRVHSKPPGKLKT
ncbi:MULTISPECIES: hypothetical protein [Paraburkholderia]|uniref:hypothetical protein n=1 Tax=Paraburkholderia TaxID=1822464 RepID=UPI002253B2B9|nr:MULTISPECIES: hypothetical protein [Paraburkholderia]MCX4156171.1 hypothetical protein [Paraburkholderia aspalathi]MDN7165577.1 hypothetical protein [Paraburkholderia sp. SECH2]MDQ6394063.1 hypothetical protein [Paraburkholderia aspalathi]